MFKFKSIDERFLALGFRKIHENEYGVRYEHRTSQGYVHVIAIICKDSGNHLIQSYEMKINKDGFNNMVGMTEPVTKLALKKLRELKKKYKWEA